MKMRFAAVPLVALALMCAACAPTASDATEPSDPASPVVSRSTPDAGAAAFDGDCARVAEVVSPGTLLGGEFEELVIGSGDPDPAAAAWWRDYPQLQPAQTIGGTSCKWTGTLSGGPVSTVEVDIFPREFVPAEAAEYAESCDFMPLGEGNVVCLARADSGDWWVAGRAYLSGDEPDADVLAGIDEAVNRLADAMEGTASLDHADVAGWWSLPACDVVVGSLGEARDTGWPDPTQQDHVVLHAAGAYDRCWWSSGDNSDVGGAVEIAPGAGPRWNEIVAASSLSAIDVAGADAAKMSVSPTGVAVVVARSGANVLLVSADSVDSASDAAGQILSELDGAVR